MNEKMIDPKPLGAHELPTSEVVPRVETEPNQFDKGCGAKDAIEHAAIALDRNSKSENLSEQSSGANLATPRNAEGRGTEDPTNRALTSENVTRMLEELSQKEVSRVKGSAPSFSEDYTDAIDEVSKAFSHLKITLDRDSQKVKRLLEFWEPPSEDNGPKDARVHLSCDFSTRKVNKSSLASRVPPSYSGGYRAAAVAKGATNLFGEVGRDANRNSEMSSLAAREPSSYSEGESVDNAAKAATISGEQSSYSKEESADKTKIAANTSKETDKSSLASWERDYSEDDSTEGATEEKRTSSASSQAGSDFEGEIGPNWLDPRSVPAIRNRPGQVEPCLPDTYFKLHHNGPFSYTGRAEPGEQTPLLLEEQEDVEEGRQEKDELEDMEEGQQEKDEQDEKALSQVSYNEPLIASTETEGDSDGIADVPGVFRRLPAWRRLTVVEQGEEAEEYDPEFPALSTPSEKLSAASLEKIGDMPNAVTKWLYSQSFHSVESKRNVVESLARYSLLCYDDEEDEPQTEGAPKEDEDQLEKRDISRLQLNEAIPECCLTDSVFLVDRPKDAVTLGFKLPPLSLEGCAVEAFIKIRVTHVYTPFQFWFNFVEQGNDVGMLTEMESEMKNFFNDRNPDYLNVLPGCLLKPGYMCAVRTEASWRRARILGTPPPGVATVSIYYVDYGSHADVSAGDLRYLSTHFGELPALAVRGTLSYIHPPDTHWPPDSMEQFHRLVIGKELFAHINEVDLVEQILFLRISQNKEFQPSINRMLVDARLAGKSLHYDQRHIKNNLGRRKRYLRERLPSHEMLETGVFPVLNEEFEVEFDGIIYSPAFGRFEVPNVKAEYSALREALVAWMPAYRKETEHWARLYREEKIKLREAQRKIREDWLATQSRAEQETDDRLVALHSKIDEAIGNTEKVEAMAPDSGDESSEPDQEGDMDMVD